MSLHLKVGAQPMAKRGSIGEMHYQTIRDDVVTESEIKEYVADIEDGARASPRGFVELDEPGMTIVQFRDFRIAIARPPFADAMEITAVRPIVKTDMDDYEDAEELRERLTDHQRGVLISGGARRREVDVRPGRRRVPHRGRTTPSRRWRSPGTSRSARRSPSTPRWAGRWPRPPTRC